MQTGTFSPFRQRPATKAGKWAVGLAAAFVVMFVINSAVFMPLGQLAPDLEWRRMLLPFYGILMMLCGLCAGALALFALVWRHERSWMVWLVLLPSLFVVMFLLGEVLIPH